MTEDSKATVTLKHTSENGATLWQTTYAVESPSLADAELTSDGDKVLLQWPDGLALFYMRPGERIEIIGKDVSAE